MFQLNVFMSHSSSDKELVSKVVTELGSFVMDCFVAHEDIEPTSKWQQEIKKRLNDMHLMVAFVTEHYHSSIWCNQELGFALGKNVPIIPLRLSANPQGFISNMQALTPRIPKNTFVKSRREEVIARDIETLALKFTSEYDSIRQWVVYRLINSKSYDEANGMSAALKGCLLSQDEIMKIRKAKDKNSQIAEAWEVDDNLPQIFS